MRTESPSPREDQREPRDPASCTRSDAALRQAFELLGRRWTGPIIGALRSGPAGFREIARALDGISDSMLSARLSELTEAGVLERTVAPGPPVGVAYGLTDAGRALIPALAQLSAWATAYLRPPAA